MQFGLFDEDRQNVLTQYIPENNPNSTNIARSRLSNVFGSKICRSTSDQIIAILTKVRMSVPVFVPAIVKVTCSHNAWSTSMQMIESRSTSPSEICFTLCEIRTLDSHRYVCAFATLRCFNNLTILGRRSNLPGKMCLSKNWKFHQNS